MVRIYKRLWVYRTKRWLFEMNVAKATKKSVGPVILVPDHPVLARAKDGPFRCDTCEYANQACTLCRHPYIVASYGPAIAPGDCCDFHKKGPRGTSQYEGG